MTGIRIDPTTVAAAAPVVSTETFSSDNQNRLTQSTVTGQTAQSLTTNSHS